MNCLHVVGDGGHARVVRDMWRYATPPDGCVVAIGDNGARAARQRELEAEGRTMATVVHPSAVVAGDVTLGGGTVVCAGAVLVTGATVWRGCLINTRASVDHDCALGDYVHIGPGAVLAGNVTVGEGAFVGAGAVVIQGVSVGAWATVGAGAVVIRDVPPGAVAVGVPARVVREALGEQPIAERHGG